MDIRTFIGDRSFYKKVFTIAVPIMIQNGITNFVALLDNIMVGQLGTAQMSGTAVINQLLFVFNLCIFGILAGPGIYGAQFFGKGSSEGVRNTFRFKLYAGLLVLLAGGAILSLFSTELISSYLTGNGEESNKALILQSGLDYLGNGSRSYPIYGNTDIRLHAERDQSDACSHVCRPYRRAHEPCA